MNAPVTPPSGWQIMKAIELVHQHLNETADVEPDADPDAETEAQALLAKLREKGTDVTSFMETLLLASDDAKAEAEVIHARIDALRAREARRLRTQERYRTAVLHIMATFPELFPPKPKSKSLLFFHSPAVDARVQGGREGIQVIDPEKLMRQDRFVKKVLDESAVREAVLTDGEIIDGVERKNGAPFLVVKAN